MLTADDETADARVARGPSRRARLAGLLRAAPRQERRLVTLRARPRSPTACSPGCCWPAAIRSATRRPGRARSRNSCSWPTSTPGPPRSSDAARRAARRTRGSPACRRWSSATRPSSSCATSPSKAGPCATCGRPCGRPERAGYTVRVCRLGRHHRRRAGRSCASRRRPGAAARPSAGSRWRWAVSATRPTATAPPSWRSTPRHRLRGFLHFVPWGDDGLSLDLMRRDRDAENGINEFLIVSALREAPWPGRRADVAELRGLPLGAGARGDASAPARS